MREIGEALWSVPHVHASCLVTQRLQMLYIKNKRADFYLYCSVPFISLHRPRHHFTPLGRQVNTHLGMIASRNPV
jgi:hypothetical protein